MGTTQHGKLSLIGLLFGTLAASTAIASATSTAATATSSDSDQAQLSPQEWRSIREQMYATRFHFTANENQARAENLNHGLALNLSPEGAQFQPIGSTNPSSALHMRTTAIGRGRPHPSLSAPSVAVDANRASLDFGQAFGFEEWFVNSAKGIEHGYTIFERPAGDGELNIAIELGNFVAVAQDTQNLHLRNPDSGQQLQYKKLQVFDSNGSPIEAEMRPSQQGLLITFNDQGASYPITVDPLIQSETLLPDPVGPSNQQEFAHSLAISGDGSTLVVGDPNNRAYGGAFVYRKVAGNWELVQVLQAPDLGSSSLFGWSVSISGNSIAVGCPGNDTNGFLSGAAYVFVFENGQWVHQRTLVGAGTDRDDQFGYSIAIDGDTLVVGALRGDGSGNFNSRSGAAFVFTRTGTDWSSQSQLPEASGGGGENQFGHSVALAGDTAVVGAPFRGLFGSTPTEGAAFVYRRSGNTWNLESQLPVDTTTGIDGRDAFGHSVAISADTIIVGAIGNSDAGQDDSGSAYVFTRSPGGSAWSEQARLNATTPVAFSKFGTSVAIFGERAIVGSTTDNSAVNGSGAAYIFTRNAGSWGSPQKISATNPKQFDFFGSSVALAGTTALVGAPSRDDPAYGAGGSNSNSGSAHVFNLVAGSWSQQQEIIGQDGASQDVFGDAIAMDGDTLVVGNPGDKDAGFSTGSASVFVRATDGWMLEQKLLASDLADFNAFGTAVALTGDTAFVGATGTATGGGVYRFERNAGNWAEAQKLTATDAQNGDLFGSALAANANVLIVGAPYKSSETGAAYIFRKGMPDWDQERKLLASNGAPGDRFGSEVAIFGDTALVGSPRKNAGATQSGSAYVFAHNAGNWTEQAPILLPAVPKNFANYGGAVAISGNTLVVGATQHDGVRSNSGSAQVFINSGGSWSLQDTLFASDADGADYFGSSVALLGDRLIVGAPGDAPLGSPGTSAFGAAYVFVRVGGAWGEPQKVFPNNGISGDDVGLAVALSANTVAVAAPERDTVSGVDSGAVLLFEAALDYGDAPQASDSGFANSYPTLLADDGARHEIGSWQLGIAVDADEDGQPNATATGDDVDANPNDEDGVSFNGIAIGATAAQLTATTSTADVARINAWIDFDQDGIWEAGEQIISDELVNGSSEAFSFAIPASATAGNTFARVRASSAGGDAVTGRAVDGEVEDYQINLALPTLSVTEAQINEGDSGTTNLAMTVTLSAAVSGDVSFDFATRDGEATTADDDYTSTSGRRTILGGNGTTSTIINVPILGDTTFEPEESFNLDISNASGATIAVASEQGTIDNDDPEPTINLSLNGSPLAENGGVATVTATLSNPSHKQTTINLTFTGTASAGDYSASATSIVIAAGQTSGSMTLTGIDDMDPEGDETIVVSGRLPLKMFGQGSVTATITDDDVPPTVSLALADSPVAENGGVATVTASLSASFTQDVTVNLAFSGTAAATDYNASATQILITTGNTSGSITLTGVDDNIFEGDETIIIDIDSVTNGSENGNQQVTATITDDETEPTVSLSLTDSPFGENGGVATVTAILSGPTSQATTVDLSFSGAAATGGIAPANDYSASGSQILIAAGDLSGSITLTGVDDETFEGDETVIIDITTVTKATENGEQQLTATISDDETAPRVSLVLSGNPLQEDGGVATVTANLSNPSTQDVTVDLAFSGTAATTDYTASNLPLLIRAGFSSGISQIRGVADNTFEGDETIIVDISSVTNGSEDGEQQVTATITDDQTQPVVTLSSSVDTFAENGGTAAITATLNNTSTQTVGLDLIFSGNATIEDYSRSAERIDIAPGANSGSITLTGIDDEIFEGFHNIEIAIGNVSNGVAGTPNNLALSVIDDDNPPRASLALSDSPLSENGGVAVVTVNLTNPATVAIEVGLSFSGSASASDYSPSASQVIIQPGDTSGSINLTGLDDTLVEGNETIIVDIDTVAFGVEDGPQQVTATISDNDVAAPPPPPPGGGGGGGGGFQPPPATPVPTTPTPTATASPSPEPQPDPDPGPEPSPSLSPPPASPSAPPATPPPTQPPATPSPATPSPSTTPTNPGSASPSPVISPSPSPTGPSGPVVNGPVAPGSTNVAVLAFLVQNFGQESGRFSQLTFSLDSISGTLEDFRRVRLVLDSNNNGQADPGEPVVAEATELSAAGPVQLVFTEPVSINAGQVIAFVVVADLN